MRRLELPPSVLKPRAIVYVRQSTGIQVEENLESQRRQYELAEQARTYGFRDVVVIDDDLGISASGTHTRPGFESLVRQICEGIVGAVFCLEASRLARNGRDWHHLLELCGLVGARVFDAATGSTHRDRSAMRRDRGTRRHRPTRPCGTVPTRGEIFPRPNRPGRIRTDQNGQDIELTYRDVCKATRLLVNCGRLVKVRVPLRARTRQP